ncbi:Fibronectin-binding A domain protein [Ammonifex degensii KC4]|uniref:Rqc2 homolog RqcH n=1 Tax=Ammonifex degensii (strain DSM 10501 / KC4) TaxID=429009 RepID=C9R802_AMMDK|nr:NFACT RNA binding domain-containing protein [Ammonifex degensii]ACX52431.1 Fibronectin-binding A domain protein [Ammonifex degensii KC4]
MPFDGLTLNRIVQELKQELVGGRIERIYQPTELELLFVVRCQGKKQNLWLSAQANAPRVHLTALKERPNSRSSAFLTLLRRYLEGGRIAALEQPGLERILHLNITTTDELRRPVNYRLVVEIMGKHSNIILLEPEEGKILDGIKRYSHALSRYREVLPGRPYRTPQTDKLDPRSLAEEDFFAATLSSLPPATPLAKAIQQRFQGLGLPTAREVVLRAGLKEELLLEECGLYELRKLFLALKELVAEVTEGKSLPTLVLEGGKPVEFFPFAPLSFPNQREHGSMNEVVDRFYTLRTEAQRLDLLRQQLARKVGRRIEQAEKRLGALNALLEEKEPEKFRLWGELILANLHRLVPGMEEAVLENYHEPDSPPVTVPLDPSLTPVECAQRYFELYRRAKKARDTAQAEKERLEEELAYLASVATALSQAERLEELEEIAAEIEEEETGRPAPSRPEAPRPLKFVSPSGFTVWVGKNNRQNEYVTFKLASPDDLWLHARGVPGAHVVLKTGGKDPAPEDLRFAATLAAYFSQARQSTYVPVDYTRRANVRRPAGSRPGLVIYTQEQTLFVKPEEARKYLF